MNAARKAAWIEALRSGNFAQGKSCLKFVDSEGSPSYCCLGVLCEIEQRKFPVVHAADITGTWDIGFVETKKLEEDGGVGNIYHSLRHDIGEELCNVLIRMNDQGKSFNEIADEIENLAVTD